MLPGGNRARTFCIVLSCLAGLLTVRPAAAQLDLTGPWSTRINIPFGPSFDCVLDVVQIGMTFNVTGECSAIGVIDVDGVVDLMTGAMSGAGTAGPACPMLTLTGGSANLDGTTFTSNFQCAGGPLTVPGTIFGFRCGNGVIDSAVGEDCEDGNRLNGDCCSSLCVAEPAGQNCAFDANQCTSDVCDGVGFCVHPNRTGPCDDGNQCTGGDECIDGSCASVALPDGSFCTDDRSCTTESCQAGACATTPVADGTPCDDTINCTEGSTCAAGFCQEGAPTVCPACMQCLPLSNECVVEGFRSGCGLFSPLRSSLMLKNTETRDLGKWKWSNAYEILPEEFGDPLSTGFEVCVLDEQHQPNGEPMLLLGAAAPPGAGWQSTPSGYNFKSADKSLKIRLKAGDAGRGKVQFRAKGPAHSLAYLPPMSNLVTVYVRTPAGAVPDICVAEAYDTPATNTEKKYKAHKPLP
jgi:cysteine-rich repeat protein